MEKTKRKFNLVDLFVIIAVVAVVAFAGFKLYSGSLKTVSQPPATYEIIFETEESTTYSLEAVEAGDPVCDESNNFVLGEVVEKPELFESKAHITTADGKYVRAPRDGYSSAKIKIIGEGIEYQHGAKFQQGQYSIGQTITIRAGKAKLYGRIYDIKKIG